PRVDGTRRISGDDRVRLDVLRDHSSGGDHGAAPHGDAGEHDRAVADPDVVPDLHRVVPRSASVADPRRAPDRDAEAMHVVVVAADDADTVRDQDAVPDPAVAFDRAALADVDAVADAQGPRRPEHGADPEMNAAAERDVRANGVAPVDELPEPADHRASRAAY